MESQAITSALSDLFNFHKYQYDQLIKPRDIKYNSLTPQDQQLLQWYPQHTEILKNRIHHNKECLQSIAYTVGVHWGFPDPQSWEPPTTTGFDRVRSLLLQLTREWSDEGEEERNPFDLLYDLQPPLDILIPGCGTGRIMYDLAARGHNVHGNEFGYHVVILNQFMLNFYQREFVIYPFLHKLSNVVSRDNQIRPVTIKKEDIELKGTMTMSGGSFIDIYGPNGLQINEFYLEENHECRADTTKFDTIITCFFIDTSPNIIDYLRTIHHRLHPHGTWINLGPLQWHFEDDFNVTTITTTDGITIPSTNKGLELSNEDLFLLINQFFTITQNHQLSTTYATDPTLLAKNIYQCLFWIATPIPNPQPTPIPP